MTEEKFYKFFINFFECAYNLFWEEGANRVQEISVIIIVSSAFEQSISYFQGFRCYIFTMFVFKGGDIIVETTVII